MNKEIKLVVSRNVNDAYKIQTIMQRVYCGMEDKTLYVVDSLDHVRRVLSEKGFAILAYDGENLIGVLLVCRPHRDENYGNDIGLSKSLFRHVLHMESVAIMPEYRGRNLFSEMLEFAEFNINEREYNFLMATASPYNTASCKTLERNGYRAKVSCLKYDGLRRFVYLKVLNENFEAGNPKLLKITKKQNYKCAYCGGSMVTSATRATSHTLEHIVPKAVAKWSNNPNKVFKLLNSNDNLVSVHFSCNESKGSRIFTPNEFDKFCVYKPACENYRSLYMRCAKDINRYTELKSIVMASQLYKCCVCGDSISLNNSVLRRKDNTKKREIENACLVCIGCNDDHFNRDEL